MRSAASGDLLDVTKVQTTGKVCPSHSRQQGVRDRPRHCKNGFFPVRPLRPLHHSAGLIHIGTVTILDMPPFKVDV
tara:strand:- start:16858 stop:17085 length:228 start_codon:yes stop_codon:yes gene_type:complete